MAAQRIDSGLLPGFERLECLWRSVETVKSWLDIVYRIPPAKCVGLPFHFWSQMIRTITILKHLSTLQDPAWDCQAVLNKVDVMSVMDWMAKKLDLVSEEAGLQPDNDIFKLLSKLLSGSRAWAAAKWNMPAQMQAEDVAPPQTDLGATGVYVNVQDLDQMAWMYSMDLENEKWFEDVLGWPPVVP
jgi:hypothetical protein